MMHRVLLVHSDLPAAELAVTCLGAMLSSACMFEVPPAPGNQDRVSRTLTVEDVTLTVLDSRLQRHDSAIREGEVHRGGISIFAQFKPDIAQQQQQQMLCR